MTMLAFVITISLFICLLLAYMFYKKTVDYWKNRNVPFIEPDSFHGNTRGMGTEYHTYKFMKQVYDQLKNRGPFGGAFISIRPTAIVTDLDLVKTILVKDFSYFPNRGIYYNTVDDPISEHVSNIEDDHWKNIRSKLTPTFTSGKLKLMFETILQISEGLTKTIDKDSQSGSLEIKDVLARFTSDTIGNIAFGIDCDSLNEKDSKFFEMAVKSMDSFDFIKRLVLMGYKKLARAMHIKLTPSDVSAFYEETVKSIVAYRSHNNIKRPDLMNSLMNMLSDESLNISQVCAQSFFYFVAGYETTSTALTFCIYELSMNPDIQDKARREVLDVFENHQKKLTYECLNELVYLEKIVKESLRKWPPSVSIQREARVDYKVPNSMLVIEKGCAVMIPVYGIHHDPDIYPNPDLFDPSRFDADQIEDRHAYAFLPFGEGPRGCPGVRFSMMETKICLAKLLMNYNFTLDYKRTETPITIAPSKFMMSSDRGVYVNFRKL